MNTMKMIQQYLVPMMLPKGTVFIAYGDTIQYELMKSTDVFFLDEPRFIMENGKSVWNYVYQRREAYTRPILTNEDNPCILGHVEMRSTFKSTVPIPELISKYRIRTRYIEYDSHYYRVTEDSLVNVEKPASFIPIHK
jgi:hypothetical protein